MRHLAPPAPPAPARLGPALATSTLKGFTHGTHRTIDPTELVANITPLLPRAGVTRLATITGLDCLGVPTVSAVRPTAKTLAVASGKGLSIGAATASATMEAIELFCAERTLQAGVHATPDEMARDGDTCVPLERLPLRAHAILPRRRAIRWTAGFDLLRGRRMLVPTSLVTLDDLESVWNPFRSGSNGLASGSNLVEALLAGLLEVVERDAVARGRIAAREAGGLFPRLRLASARAFPLVDDLVRQIQSAGAEVSLYGCASSTQVAVYYARIWDRHNRRLGVYSGSGAHLDPEIALLRAITEAAQSRAVYIAGTRDDVSARSFAQHRAHDTGRVIEALRQQPETVSDVTCQDHASVTFEQDIQYILARLESIGCTHCVVVDLTPADFHGSLSVVRVIVPGLLS